MTMNRIPAGPTRAGETPFAWAVYDRVFDAPLVDAARDTFPRDDWPGWVRYSSPGEKKLAANARLPAACRELLDRMNDFCPADLRPDPVFFAAGLNAMPHDGFLDVHLDSSAHPVNGYRRAVNAILFLDDWQEAWGGALQLWNEALTASESVYPAAGRLVLFECGDTSYHGVKRLCAPPGTQRRSLCAFWYEPVVVEVKRSRAQFVAMPGEPPEPLKDQWRSERSRPSAGPVKEGG